MKQWAGVGEAYAASYASLCAGTIGTLTDMLGPGGGRTVLDVGSGTGDLVARLAREGWRATGCDPEASMRAVAEREHPEVPFIAGGLPRLPFDDDSFDAVTANFVLNHVDDPRRSAGELARVAGAGAPLAATVWVSSPSWFWREVCERADLEPAAGERLPPQRDFARTADGLTAMLRDAGWREVSSTESTWVWEVSSAALWSSAEGGVASAGLFYGALNAAARVRFRRGFDATCAAHGRGGVLSLPHTAAVGVGRAP
ncbi:methyltransferase domain-containing protein [uncultured Microbacterium sp.]|uniref:class I SAM-dependent methyltransferase n=1 Tax=uncultured Microbacterium sp. TaxID=191216 RepID=UPI0028DB1563|nr:methyltransferase domain-containing protein [uncultured Microbacterium sp.]